MKHLFSRNILNTLKGLLLVGLFLPISVAEAQIVSATAELDSSLLFIGGQMKLTLEVSQPKNIRVAFPNYTDTIIAPIEIVGMPKTDTTYNEASINIKRVYTITSFDSGLHYISPIEFQYMDGEMLKKVETRGLALNVINPFVEVDPQKGVFDIKQPFNLPFSMIELGRFFFWLSLFFLLQAIVGIGWVIWSRRDKPIKSIFIKEKPKELPHVVALRELDQVKNEKLWQKGQVKEFHSKITDILRKYMEERYGFNAMEQTSFEILQELKKIELPDSKLLEKMEKTFTTADLAKFAKYEPLPDENDLSLISSFFFVNQTKEEPVADLEKIASDKKTTKEEESTTVQTD